MKLPIKPSSLALLVMSLFLSFVCNAATDSQRITPVKLMDQLGKQDILVIDVRTLDEYRSGHVPGAVNIPHTNLSQQINKLAEHKNTPVVVYCRSGRRADIAEKLLVDAGFSQVFHLEGDMNGWEAGKFPMEK